MTYRFYPDRHGFLLTEVKKQVGEPCGLMEVAIFTTLRSRIEIQNAMVHCSVDEPAQLELKDRQSKSYVNFRPKVYFSSFAPDSVSVRVGINKDYSIY